MRYLNSCKCLRNGNKQVGDKLLNAVIVINGIIGQRWPYCALSYMVPFLVKVDLDTGNKTFCHYGTCEFNSSFSYFKTIIAR